MWLPLARAVIRALVDESMYLVNDRSWKLALPAPPPPPMWVVPDCDMPQLQARTSMSPFAPCSLSADSPLMLAPMLMNISNAMLVLLSCRTAPAEWLGGQAGLPTLCYIGCNPNRR